VAALFLVGFGVGKLISAYRSGEFLVATTTAEATSTAEAATPAPTQTEALSWRFLERQPWRQAAARLGDPDDIKRRAMQGEARAQTMACLGHMAGVEGFLPSPTAAREFCDAASAQHEPGGLYLSWVLHKTAPHAGIGGTEAHRRLAEAAQLGWSAALIDYGQVLMPDARAPLEAQAEAGRLWLAAAEAGDPRGQYQYARWLRDSRAGPRDPVAAVPYLDRAATGGQPEAMHMLATLYRDGIGVPRNLGRAQALYEQAARQRHPPSMFNLADLLRQGSRDDRARAIELYKQLACMRDEHQIQPLAVQRLRALQESAVCR
jgi:TPR repeat protein